MRAESRFSASRLAAVAAIEPQNSTEAFSAFFRSFISQNGTTYGVEIFGSLPWETMNERPDLIPEEIVFKAYGEWMTWASRTEGPDVWRTLRDSVIE